MYKLAGNVPVIHINLFKVAMERNLSLVVMEKVVEMAVRNVVAQGVPSTIARLMQLITIMTVLLTVHRVIKGVGCAPSSKL